MSRPWEDYQPTEEPKLCWVRDGENVWNEPKLVNRTDGSDVMVGAGFYRHGTLSFMLLAEEKPDPPPQPPKWPKLYMVASEAGAGAGFATERDYIYLVPGQRYATATVKSAGTVTAELNPNELLAALSDVVNGVRGNVERARAVLQKAQVQP